MRRLPSWRPENRTYFPSFKFGNSPIIYSFFCLHCFNPNPRCWSDVHSQVISSMSHVVVRLIRCGFSPEICSTDGVRGVTCGGTCVWCGSTAASHVAPPSRVRALSLGRKSKPEFMFYWRLTLWSCSSSSSFICTCASWSRTRYLHPLLEIITSYCRVFPLKWTDPGFILQLQTHVAGATGESFWRSWVEQLPLWNPTRGSLPYFGAARPRRRFSAAGAVWSHPAGSSQLPTASLTGREWGHPL